MSVIDSMGSFNFKSTGVIDNDKHVGDYIGGIPVVGCDSDLKKLRDKYESAFISLGSVGYWHKRQDLANILESMNYQSPCIIHPRAYVSGNASINAGILIGAMVMVNACTQIGKYAILNTSCIVEHNCILEDFVHIAPGAVLCADVSIGRGSHIGAGSVVKQGISIGQNVIVGIGSVVINDIPDDVIAYGNPCKVMCKRS